MTFDKSCPGSRSIREPIPEYMKCPDCGKEVEIWTDELKATCRNCGGKVLRAQQASCIEWCPHAKECVGPDVYERLMGGSSEEPTQEESPVDAVSRDHERAVEKISLLRAASLCLKLGSAGDGSQVWAKGVDHLAKVLEFINKDIGLHFHREELALFPTIEKKIGTDKSPTGVLLKEHKEMWRQVDALNAKLAELQENGGKPNGEVAAQVQEIGGRFESALKDHIRKENDGLLPLAKTLLGKEEQEKFIAEWKSITLETSGSVKK